MKLKSLFVTPTKEVAAVTRIVRKGEKHLQFALSVFDDSDSEESGYAFYLLGFEAPWDSYETIGVFGYRTDIKKDPLITDEIVNLLRSRIKHYVVGSFNPVEVDVTYAKGKILSVGITLDGVHLDVMQTNFWKKDQLKFEEHIKGLM